jgi:hypothetical protein
MMSIESIVALSRELAVNAYAEGVEPYVPANADEPLSWNRIPIPNMGSYSPAGWKELNTAFVDKTGAGRSYEPAMTIDAFKLWASREINEHPGCGFAIVEEGEFQVYIASFIPDETVEGDQFEYIECEMCGYGFEEHNGDKTCPKCEYDPDACPECECNPCECWDEESEGAQAYTAGSSQEANPYPVLSEEWETWDEDWKKAKQVAYRNLEQEGNPTLF